MSRLAMKKGEQTDELRRIKDKSRKTQAFLSESKKVTSSAIPKDPKARKFVKGAFRPASANRAGKRLVVLLDRAARGL